MINYDSEEFEHENFISKLSEIILNERIKLYNFRISIQYSSSIDIENASHKRRIDKTIDDIYTIICNGCLVIVGYGSPAHHFISSIINHLSIDKENNNDNNINYNLNCIRRLRNCPSLVWGGSDSFIIEQNNKKLYKMIIMNNY